MKKTIAGLNLIAVLVAIFSMGEFFVTYAVVPGQYDQKTYSLEEVHHIASKERSQGMTRMRQILERQLLILSTALVVIGVFNIIYFVHKNPRNDGQI